MTNRTILSQVKGFTPLIDILIEKHDLITAAVFGRAWRYCQMENRVCGASAETLAAELSVSVKTVGRRLKLLCQEGYLQTSPTPKLNLTAATGTCAACGLNYPLLDIHHIQPRAEGGSDDPDNLIDLCPNCHRLMHCQLWELTTLGRELLALEVEFADSTS